MAITADEILRVRRMTNELDDNPSSATYTDELITAMAEKHAIVESRWPDESETVYDLHAIAAEIWEEKAAALSPEVTDGNANEFGETTDEFVDTAYKHAVEQAKRHFAQRMVRSRKPVKWPREKDVDVTL